MPKQTRKPRQLSEDEVFRDAMKILDEVLADRLGRKSFKSETSSKSNIDSSSGYYDDASRDSLDLWLKDDNTQNFAIERSQTMPSSFKLEDKDDFTQQDIIDYLKTKSDFANRRHSGSATSGESDNLDSHIGSPLRRKKSFMRRAKERLSISFRRQEREREFEDIPEEQTKKERRKKKKKKNKDKENQDVNDNKKVSKIEDDDVDISGVEMRGNRGRNRSDSTASKRGSIFDSIRRSFRTKRRPSSSMIASQSCDAVINGADDKKVPTKQRSSINVDCLPTIPAGIVVNTNSVIDLDEIEYIDEDKKPKPEPELPKPTSNRKKPAPPPPVAPPLHDVEPLGDGHTGTPVIPDPDSKDNGEMVDEVDSPTKTNDKDVPFNMKTEEEKEDLFEKIAKRLIEMADPEKTSDDTDTSHSTTIVVTKSSDHSSSVDPEKLTELELEILDCLRVGGDRLSESFDDPVQKVVEKHRQEAYTRFNDTLRKGLGDEISWHQLSLIYQTASGAIKAAGATTQLAFRVKDMTQQYVGDKFAKWIVKEGGWDTVLSESEQEQVSSQ